MTMKIIPLIAFALFATGAVLLDAKMWTRNTYPGPGHVANAGPWGEGQGSDRTEWLSAFGVSPVNPKFMLQGADLGRLVYTNTRLGGTEFVPASLPLHRVCGIAFHPTDGATAYALMIEKEMPGYGGWWRTEDEGESWSLMYPTVTPSRGQKRLLAVDPSNGDIYIGTTSGLVRSTDNGASWNTIAFSGQSIKCLAMAADGSSLYVIPGDQNWQTLIGTPSTSKGGTEFWRMDNGDPATLVMVDSDSNGLFFDVDVYPSDGGRGLLVKGDDLVEFTGGGTSQSVLQSKGNLAYARYNPSNPSHIISISAGAIWWWAVFTWSTDGGASWSWWDSSGATMPALVDYGPWNWKSTGYQFETTSAVTGGTYHYMEDRLLFDFVPGSATSVVMWATNWGKGPLRSDDYGAHFTPFAHGGNFKRPAQVSYGSTDEVIALAVTEHGFVLTGNGGREWRAYTVYNTANLMPPTQDAGTREFERRSAWGVAVDPEDDQTLVGILGYAPANILRTEDFGATWSVVGEWRPYIPQGTAWYEDGNVYWHRQNPDIVYAGNRKSTDGGLSFPTTMAYPVSAMSTGNGNRVVSKLSSTDWYVSLDAGNTWTSLPDPPAASDGLSLATGAFSYKGHAVDPSPPAGTLRILSGGEGGVWEYSAPESSPASGTWNKVSTNSFAGDPYLDSLSKPVWLHWVLFDPRPGYEDVVYAASGPPGANKDRGEMLYRQVYRSTDAGVTWAPQTGGTLQGELPGYLLPMAAGISPTGDFTLGDYAGLYTLRKTGLDDFLEAHFGLDWEALGYAGGTTDFDSDGLVEAMEYVLDLNPLVPDRNLAAQRLRFDQTAGSNRLTLTQEIGKSGVLVSAGVSGDLLNWNSGPGFVTETTTTDTPVPGSQEVEFVDQTPVVVGDPRFIRLEVNPVN